MHDPSLRLFIDDHHVRNAFAMKRVYRYQSVGGRARRTCSSLKGQMAAVLVQLEAGTVYSIRL
jgi:hypothetical protein